MTPFSLRSAGQVRYRRMTGNARALTVLLLLLSTPLMAAAQDTPASEKESAAPREKIANLIVYGDDACPRSSDDEIIVCSRLPESERYRIPKPLRRAKQKAADRSWSDRVQVLETVSRIGTPNSCSPVGSGGQTGCFDQLLSQAREERRQAQLEGPNAR